MMKLAIIKSVAFSANGSANSYLDINFTSMPAVVILLIAACFAGFVTSFLVTPIERVKVLMQASNTYKNEFDCLKSVVQNDPSGVLGLFSKGLGLTLVRLPRYCS
jgi:hypothetical protein